MPFHILPLCNALFSGAQKIIKPIGYKWLSTLETLMGTANAKMSAKLCGGPVM